MIAEVISDRNAKVFIWQFSRSREVNEIGHTVCKPYKFLAFYGIPNSFFLKAPPRESL